MTYLTVKDISVIFRTTEKTIRRWIDEGRDITFDGKSYLPKKDPGGNWLFVVRIVVAPADGGETRGKPIGIFPRRRVISNGIK